MIPLLALPLLLLSPPAIQTAAEPDTHTASFPEQLQTLKDLVGSKAFVQTERAFWTWCDRLQDPKHRTKAQQVDLWRKAFVEGLDSKVIARQCFSIRGLQALIRSDYEVELPTTRLTQLIESKDLVLAQQALSLMVSIEPTTEKACWRLNKLLGRLERQLRSHPRIRGCLQARRQQLLVQIKELRNLDPDMEKARRIGERWFANLTQARMTAKETAAIATLRNLMASEAQVQATGLIDSNANGAGEYGFFQEMAGARPVHGTNPKGKIRVRPPILSRAFAKTDADGCIQRAGYWFRIFLPGPKGRPVHEGSPKDPFPVVDAPHAEVLWCAYAWPVERGKTGLRSFFVNQRGDILASRGRLTGYSGKARAPSAHAAFRIALDEKQTLATPPASRGAAFDGNRWTIVR